MTGQVLGIQRLRCCRDKVPQAYVCEDELDKLAHELLRGYMEKHISELIQWYKEQKTEFVRNTYLDRTSRIKKFLSPYSDWDSPSVMKAEISFVVKAIARLKLKQQSSGVKITKSELSIIILSLKNRLEYASNQSDFYPIFITLVATACNTFAISQENYIKVIIAVFTLFSVTVLVVSRMSIRLRLSHIKELINILEAYKADHV